MVIKLLFKNSEVEIDEAVDGVEGVEFVKNNPNKYDLVIMDLQMPNMNGFEASKEIQKINNSLPIIAVSANISDKIIKELEKIGIYEYVSKPINMEKLYSLIDKYLKHK